MVAFFGASGQLGREWQRYITERYPDVVLLPYTSSQLDITRHEEVSHEITERQPDLIINCAAYTKVDRAEEERDRAMEVNARAVGHMAKECKKHGIRLVHYSTDYIFAGRKVDRDQFPEGYPEDHPADPVNWYGQTKWKGEEAIRASGCSHLIIRATWLCGVYGHNFVKTMLRLGREKDFLQVVDDQWGSPSFAEEVVRNTDALLDERAGGTFHLTSTGLITWFQFAEAIFEETGVEVNLKPVRSEAFAQKAERPKFSKLNTEKAEQVAGVHIRPWREVLRRLLKQIENH